MRHSFTSRLFFFLLVCLAWPCRSTAQTTRDAISIQFTGGHPYATVEDRPGRIGFVQTRFEFAAPPIRIGKRIRWQNLAYAQQREQQFQNTELPLINDATLFAFGYAQRWEFQLSRRWQVEAMPFVSLRSSLEQTFDASKELFVNGMVGLLYAPLRDSSLQIGVQVLYLTELGRDKWLPLPNVRYNSPDGRWSIDIPFPTINLLYRPNNNWEVGIYQHLELGHYRIAALPLPDGRVAHYARPETITAGLVLTRHITGPVWFTLRPGVQVENTLRLLDSDRNEIRDARLTLQQQFVLKAGISVRLAQPRP